MVKVVKRLMLRIVLENAIIFEEKAYRYYDQVARQTVNSGVKELAERLKVEEFRHRLRLEEAQRQADISLCCTSSNEIDFEDQAAQMRENWPEIDGECEKSKLLELAYRKESQARDFYLSMQKLLPLPFLKALFGNLAREEENHMEWISRLQ
jgi:rubrerythrin